ncbi:hypothetical protein SRHO_G00224240 [Serrasalmus rhombeus]
MLVSGSKQTERGVITPPTPYASLTELGWTRRPIWTRLLSVCFNLQALALRVLLLTLLKGVPSVGWLAGPLQEESAIFHASLSSAWHAESRGQVRCHSDSRGRGNLSDNYSTLGDHKANAPEREQLQNKGRSRKYGLCVNRVQRKQEQLMFLAVFPSEKGRP